MKRNDEYIEKLTSGLVKEVGVEKPSLDFTQRVMQAVMQEQKYSSKTNYWWMLLLIPVLVISGWYIIKLFNLENTVWEQFKSMRYLIKDIITITFSPFEGIKIQPVYLISFFAMLLLLSIEEMLRRKQIEN